MSGIFVKWHVESRCHHDHTLLSLKGFWVGMELFWVREADKDLLKTRYGDLNV